MERRTVLRAAVLGGSSAVFGGTLWRGAAYAAPAQPGTGPYGALGSPNANGIRLPSGFTSRVIARSGQTVPGTSYTWHNAPDGGACYADGSGWIYVSNSEINPSGGASAVKFSSTGAITGAYRILSGTRQNCAGGKTPWNTWLSCEEVSLGYVYETDPWGVNTAVRRDAMGRFKHEAAAADPVRKVIYLTEDESNGRFYRFVPTTWGNLSSGTLQVMVAGSGTSGSFSWANVPDPDGSPTSTRTQVSGSKSFNGGEGCHYADDTVWFTTKGDNRVWQLNLTNNTYELAYDDSLVTSGTAPSPASTTSPAPPPATSSSPRTAAPWTSASSPRTTSSHRSCASTASPARRSPARPSPPTEPGCTSPASGGRAGVRPVGSHTR